MPITIDDLPLRQRDVLRFIVELTQEHGYPPTLAELAKALGLKNRMTVHQHVVALKKKGLVQWEPGLNRSLRILNHLEIAPEAPQNKTNNKALFKSKNNQTDNRGIP